MTTRSAPLTQLPALEVDRLSPIPLYYQVATRLQEMIENGAIPVGSRLENELDLAEQLGVSRPTMRRAIQYLVERGMLVRKRGVGTQVVQPKVRRPVELTSLFDDLRKTGREPTTTVLVADVRPATDALADSLQVPEGAEIIWIERLRHADGEPLALMRNALPRDLVDIGRADLEQKGLYELLREAGRTPCVANEVIGARSATAAESRVLKERRGAPLLTMTRTAWDASGRAVEVGSHIYRASRYSFEMHLDVG